MREYFPLSKTEEGIYVSCLKPTDAYNLTNVVNLGKKLDEAKFNPLKTAEKYIEGDISDISIGGFGITIVKKICDSISYARKNNKNILIIEKII